MADLNLKNVNFSYGEKPVIKNLSINVEKGCWLGIIGPNGAGKTTLINLISGAIAPNNGEIKIGDKPVCKYSRNEMARMVAIVPQTNAFTFSFTSLEIVLMGRAPYAKRFGFETEEDLKIAEEVMERTDTWQLRDRPIDELSGGERQRVLIARAIAQQPKILLLDEPTTFLDIKHQRDIMDILSDLNSRRGMTIISALHDVNLAILYCAKIALLHDGSIYTKGAPADVITYANLKNIFRSEVYVGTNEFTGKPYYIPMRSEAGSNGKNQV